MNLSILRKDNLEPGTREECRKDAIIQNIHKSRILAFVVIVFEFILAAVNVVTLMMRVDNRFRFDHYLVMYSMMIVINGAYIIYTGKYRNRSEITVNELVILETVSLVYITFMMAWGSVMTLMDQKLYGQLAVFMINMIMCSVLFYFDTKKMLIPFGISTLLLAVGLPFFQSSQDILIGHYINLTVFVIISWLSSRILYVSNSNSFRNRTLLKQANELLQLEIDEKEEVNRLLAAANQKLQEISFKDELTGIPNRRSFWDHVNRILAAYAGQQPTMAVMMIDIDFFKEFNDHYGHVEGDRALIMVADIVHSTAKGALECVGRWGGEEFILAGFDIGDDAFDQMAESIRQMVYQLKIKHQYSVASEYITVSIGTFSMVITNEDDVRKGIEFSDEAMYMAKKSRRNCVKRYRVS